jgi:DNA-binding beta-propeller fold protein YncE
VTDSPIDQVLTIEFSQPMASVSTEKAIQVDPLQNVVFEWSVGGSVLEISPADTWGADKVYSITVDTTAQSAALLALVSPVSFTFETGPYYVLAAEWGGRGVSDGSFRTPYGSEIDELRGYIYITDCRNHRVQQFLLDGTLVRAWGTLGLGPGQLKRPADVKIDSHGTVYIAEEHNHRVQVFTMEGAHLGFIGSFGTGDGQLNNPLGIALDSQDNLYVVDYGNNRVQKFSPNGDFLLSWGVPGTGDGEFRGPYYMEIDDHDQVYVVDRGNHRVQKFTKEGVFVAKWGRNGGDGTSGYLEGEFDFPHEIAVGPDGEIYVADTYNGRIQVHTAEGEFSYSWEIGGWPKTVAVDQWGNVFVSDMLGFSEQVVSTWTKNVSGAIRWDPPPFYPTEFPGLLSELGLYPDAPRLDSTSSSVVFFEPEWPLWSNGLDKARYLSLPDGYSVETADRDEWQYPDGTRFFKTFSYNTGVGSSQRSRPVETRVIWKRAGTWEVAAYMWKSDGTDAELIISDRPVAFVGVDSSGGTFGHMVPSREQCLVCHEASPAFILGFSEVQLNHALPARGEAQLVELFESGALRGPLPLTPDKVTDPNELTRMVKGYAQGNCVHCHNGGVAIDFSHRNFLGNTINVTGRDGTLVIPGDPEHSALYRLFSEGKMPPLGVQLLDDEAINLIYNWIAGLG